MWYFPYAIKSLVVSIPKIKRPKYRESILMRKMLKAYFTYPPLIFFISVFLFLIFWCLHTGLLLQHWYLILIAPILQGPFEWVVHKFILHAKVKPHHKFIYRYMKRLHYDHHKEPQKPELLFAQFSASLSIFLGFYLLFALIWGQQLALVPLLGVFAGYLFYEWVHLGHHTVDYDPQTPWGKHMKEFHLWHHYKNENYWWGITMSWFDSVMGTNPLPKKVSRSEGVKTVGI